MSAGRRLAGAALGGAVLAALLAGAYFAFSLLVERLSGLDPTVATVTVAFVAALVLAARTHAAGGTRAKRIEVEYDSRKRRADVYFRLIDIWGAALRGEEFGAVPAHEPELRRTEEQFALWGDHEVIATYARLVETAARDGRVTAEALIELIYSMRRDLGRDTPESSRTAIAVLLESKQSTVAAAFNDRDRSSAEYSVTEMQVAAQR